MIDVKTRYGTVSVDEKSYQEFTKLVEIVSNVGADIINLELLRHKDSLIWKNVRVAQH